MSDQSATGGFGHERCRCRILAPCSQGLYSSAPSNSRSATICISMLFLALVRAVLRTLPIQVVSVYWGALCGPACGACVGATIWVTTFIWTCCFEEMLSDLSIQRYSIQETRRNRSPTRRVRPQWVNHPPRRSQSPSTALQSDMVSLGFVQGCFKVYGGLFRVGFRFGLRFLQDSSRFVLGYI